MSGPGDLFRQSIAYAVVASRDAYGKPTLGTVLTVPARVQPHRKLMRDAKGNDFLSTHVIYTVAQLDLNHCVWIPGANTSDLNQARRVAAVDVHVDGSGFERYRKVYL